MPTIVQALHRLEEEIEDEMDATPGFECDLKSCTTCPYGDKDGDCIKDAIVMVVEEYRRRRNL